jgi:type IX secretion system PorP/SprF family membrane protein
MKKYIYILCLFLGGMLSKSAAQDPHFSQPFHAPIYYNPAQLGNYEGKQRLSLSHRKQWASLSAPYRSILAGIEQRSRHLGLGAFVLDDATGPAGLRYFKAMAGLALRHERNEHEVSLGFQGGIIQQSFDPAQFSFDSQYDGQTGYDPSRLSGEVFPFTRTSSASIQVGGRYTYRASQPKPLQLLEVGLALGNANEPLLSFFDQEVHRRRRFSLQARAEMMIQERLRLKPSLLIMNQQPAREWQLTAGLEHEFDQETFLEAGLGVRAGDAFFPYLALQMNFFRLGISYDVTYSKLGSENRGRGGAEISLSYIFGAKDPPVSNYEKRRSGLSRDADGDGIIDAKDLCPQDAGLASLEGCPDTDGDGIRDSEDRCPAVPGIAELQGCPLQDRDGDGITDDQDACPDRAGMLAFRGCPDQDFDGLPDHVDRCPLEPGPRARLGCPNSDIDADGDAVPDKLDGCPLVAGSPRHNGCPDSDGDGLADFEDRCPDQAGDPQVGGCPTAQPSRQQAQTDCGCKQLESEISFRRAMPPIEFDWDQAVIRVRYYADLNQLVRTLSSQPRLRLLIEGHTDAEGSADYNYRLGQARAQAIVAYLTARGVASSRLTLASYGELVPKSTNQSDSGRARNRRVELLIWGEE